MLNAYCMREETEMTNNKYGSAAIVLAVAVPMKCTFSLNQYQHQTHDIVSSNIGETRQRTTAEEIV